MILLMVCFKLLYYVLLNTVKNDKPNKKYYIITNSNKKVYFGQAGASDFTLHKDEARKHRYRNRHKNEAKFWHDPDTASYLALKYLWSYPTKE